MKVKIYNYADDMQQIYLIDETGLQGILSKQYVVHQRLDE